LVKEKIVLCFSKAQISDFYQGFKNPDLWIRIRMDPHKVKLQIFFFLNLFFVFDVGSGTGKNIWIRDKHPGSATLVSCCENEKKLPAGNGETATRNCFKTKRVRSG
jgi:hypothetical protein